MKRSRHLYVLVAMGALASGCRTEVVNDECSGDDEQCDDGVECTVDLCIDGLCVNRPTDSLCGEGETCDARDGCIRACESDDECVDSVDCTVDICLSGNCVNRPHDDLCPSGQTCDPVEGCVGEGGCETDDECDDEIDCTLDVCGVDGCEHLPQDALCSDGQVCDVAAGCIDAGCEGDDDCDDDIDCTIDVCNVDGSCTHTPDNSRCEGEQVCYATVGCSDPCEDDEDCDDGNFCNGAETCEPEFGCVEADEPRDCDDNDECTIDRCDLELDECVYELNTEVEGCDTFDPSRHLNGCFTITPRVNQRCAFSEYHYNTDQVCFELLGSALAITTGDGVLDLTQNPVSGDASFSADQTISGGCNEVYRLSGTFTDANHFSGSWTTEFYGAGCLGLCHGSSTPVTGTRISGP